MAQLNTTDPMNPSYAYTSGGGTVGANFHCACQNGNTECIRLCHENAQEMLDLSLELFPEDE